MSRTLRFLSLAVLCLAAGCGSSDASPEPVAEADGAAGFAGASDQDASPDGFAGASGDDALVDGPIADAAVEVDDASTQTDGTIDAPEEPSSVEAGPDASKAANCAATFGNELTNSFGRVDGTVVAIVGPNDKQCVLVNSDHVVVQVQMHGAVYRMVASVLSTYGDPNVQLDEVDHALEGGTWQEGWHTGVAFDYVTTMGIHSSAFTPHPMNELIGIITDKIAIGDHVSVFATSSGGTTAGSAHLIHRNKTNQDGAIVLGADGPQPHYLLFRFGDQSF